MNCSIFQPLFRSIQRKASSICRQSRWQQLTANNNNNNNSNIKNMQGHHMPNYRSSIFRRTSNYRALNGSQHHQDSLQYAYYDCSYQPPIGSADLQYDPYFSYQPGMLPIGYYYQPYQTSTSNHYRQDYSHPSRVGSGSSIFRHRPYEQQHQRRSYSTSCNSASPTLRPWKQHYSSSIEQPIVSNNGNVSHVDFRVLSYNILAQCHLEFNPYLYTHVRNPNWLNWPLRRLNLLSDIRCLRADVICLQEVEPEAYANYFEPEMHSLGFDGRYLAKTGKALDGCAIFWRRDTFQMEQYEPIEFFNERLQPMAYHNVAQLAVLSPLCHPASRLAIVNTHLLFNPNRGDAKLLQSATILATIARAVPPGTPAILCGDLNSQPNSALFKLFLEGHLCLDSLLLSDISMQNATSFSRRRSQATLSPDLITKAGFSYDCQFLDADGRRPTTPTEQKQQQQQQKKQAEPAMLSHNLGFKSAYDYRNSDGLFTVTSYTSHDTCTVDAIFYSAGIGSQETQQQQQQEDRLVCLAQLNLLTPRQLNEIGGIPNRLQSSDHLPLCADFRLRLSTERLNSSGRVFSSKL